MQGPSTYSQINPQFPEHEHLKCPRCDSNNTKFCYYNNYNLSQPRHFCKNCRRYWTKGGTLRNIPIGGGTRKTTKRSKRSPSSPAPPPATASSLSAQSQTKPEPSGDRDGRLDGSFSSLLTAGGQFGNFLNMEPVQVGDPNSDESGMIQNPATEFQTNNNDSGSCLGGGDDGSEYWNGGNGWPGLSIYTPGSDF